MGDAGAAALAGRLPSLRRVDIASGRLSDAGVAALARLPCLARLALPRSRGVGDGGLAALTAAPGARARLTSLDVAGTGVTSAGVAGLAALASLRHLVTRGALARPAAAAALADGLPLLTDVKT